MKKTYTLTDKGLKADIEIETDLDEEIDYVLEMNLHFNNLPDARINGKKAEEMQGKEGKKFVIGEECTRKCVAEMNGKF